MSQPRELAVLFASDDVVVLDKPSGVATEPDRRGEPSLRDDLAQWLRGRGSRGTPHAVSRLDVPVTGAVTFAISERGKRAAAAAKEAGLLQRRYLALVAGQPPDEVVCDVAIEGRPASSELRVGGRVEAGRNHYAVLHLAPRTGRTHQLRIHASAIGAPIVGDRRYGGPSSVADAKGRVLAARRVMLHAAIVLLRLGLPTDPEGPIVSPAPADLLAMWALLGGTPDAFAPRLPTLGFDD